RLCRQVQERPAIHGHVPHRSPPGTEDHGDAGDSGAGAAPVEDRAVHLRAGWRAPALVPGRAGPQAAAGGVSSGGPSGLLLHAVPPGTRLAPTASRGLRPWRRTQPPATFNSPSQAKRILMSTAILRQSTKTPHPVEESQETKFQYPG